MIKLINEIKSFFKRWFLESEIKRTEKRLKALLEMEAYQAAYTESLKIWWEKIRSLKNINESINLFHHEAKLSLLRHRINSTNKKLVTLRGLLTGCYPSKT